MSKQYAKFGLVSKESVISYQQKLESGCLINFYGELTFPYFPVKNLMHTTFNTVLDNRQTVALEGS